MRVSLGRMRRVNLRDNRARPQTNCEKGEERETRQIHLARTNAVLTAEDFQLRVKDVVRIGDPFGWTSAA